MKCNLKNFCEKNFLCCHFCPNKKCWQRCNDKIADCKWFSAEKVDISDVSSVQAPPKGYYKTKPILQKNHRKNSKSVNN